MLGVVVLQGRPKDSHLHPTLSLTVALGPSREPTGGVICHTKEVVRDPRDHVCYPCAAEDPTRIRWALESNRLASLDWTGGDHTPIFVTSHRLTEEDAKSSLKRRLCLSKST